ncbi:MAG: hypothetical protein K0U93_07280 [Gammaproteobacteria bacterium]|nr:hypothetical protein [Gammaproteobacteria bacterium]
MDDSVASVQRWVVDHYGIDLDKTTAQRLHSVGQAVQRALDTAADPDVFETEPAMMLRAHETLRSKGVSEPTSGERNDG